MISRDIIDNLQTEYDLPYQLGYVLHCDEVIGFEGKKVLEIGTPLPSELTKDIFKVSQWHSINTSEIHNSPCSQAQSLTTDQNQKKYFCDYYDIVFSISQFHKISNFYNALTNAYKALNHGGKLFAIFSPVWSSVNGHCLYEKIDNKETIALLQELIPPWGHLVMSKASMLKILLDKFSMSSAAEILYQVYNAPDINRFFTEDYLAFISNSKFKIIKFDGLFNRKVAPYTQEMLEKIYDGRKQFGNEGLLIILEK